MIILILPVGTVHLHADGLNPTKKYASFFDSFSKGKFKEFKKRRDISITIPTDSSIVGVSRSDFPKKVLLETQIPGAGRILYAKIRETRRVNINRHLIQGQEFMFNPKTNNLMILLDIPLIYLVEGSINIKMEILALNSRQTDTFKIRKTISFNWRPLKINEPDDVGFHYTSLIAGKFVVDEFKTLRGRLFGESQRANRIRFTPSYRDKVMRSLKK
jgi:hypothetical protein